MLDEIVDPEFVRTQPRIIPCRRHKHPGRVWTYCARCLRVICLEPDHQPDEYSDYVIGHGLPVMRLCNRCNKDWKRIWKRFRAGKFVYLAEAVRKVRKPGRPRREK